MRAVHQVVSLLAVLSVCSFWTAWAIPCNDTTTPRPPDSSCPPDTQGALGLSGFIESSTVQSCSKFDKQEIDCGDGNATVIVLGIIPGQQAPVLNLNVITHHETEFEEGARCTAEVDGKCVTIEPIELTVTASDSVLVWSLQDTNIDTYYAYTHAFSGATTQQAKKESELDDDCGVVDYSDSEIGEQQTNAFYSQTCFPMKVQVPQADDEDDIRLNEVPDDEDWTGVLLYPEAVDCVRQLQNQDYTKRVRRFNAPEYCTVPYPKTQNPHRASALGLDETTGMQASNVATGYGAYRFPSYLETCRFGLFTYGEIRDVCYAQCTGDDDDAPTTTGSAAVDDQWTFFDADLTNYACGERCLKKYAVLSDNQPCRVWAGNYATQMPMQGAELRTPRNTIVSNDLKGDLEDYLSKDENSDNVAERVDVIQNSLLSTRSNVFNYATYLWHKRPICPGCPGPYGPWKYWLYPRKPLTSRGDYSDNPPPSNGEGWYPHHTQCYEDDDECCDAFVYQTINNKRVVPAAECKYSQLGDSICPMRRGVVDLSDQQDDDSLDSNSFSSVVLNTDELLPPYLTNGAFDIVSNGFRAAGNSFCTSVFPDASPAFCEFYAGKAFTDLGVIFGAIAAKLTANILNPLVLLEDIGAVVTGIYNFVTELNRNAYYLTTSSAMGFMYPQCRAYAIREQPALYVEVDAQLKFTERSGQPVSELKVGNIGSIAKPGTEASKSIAEGGSILLNSNQETSLSDASLDRSVYMRILNLDSTAQAVGRNVGGVITVCNATNHLIFEADPTDLTKNPWDNVEKRQQGIYTTLPAEMFMGDPEYGATTRHPNKCNQGQSNGDCNVNSWWYMDKREHYGNGCGQLGIDEGFFASTYNTELTCRAPLQNCIPGLNPAYIGEQVYGFEDRVSDRIQGTDTERQLRDSIDVQTPCQISGHMQDIEQLQDPNQIASRLNPAVNRVNPLPPNWVELEGGATQPNSGFSNPKYALHGTNLLYYGTFNRAAGTNYIRVEIVIAGNVVSATETVSTGEFERGTSDPTDENNPSCGLVIDGTGGYSVIVRNTGSQPSAYRIKGQCNDPELLVATVDVPTLRGDETRRLNVRIDHIQTDETTLNARSPVLPVCEIRLVHPVYDITFDTLKTVCSVVDKNANVTFIPNPLTGCTSWDAPECSADIRSDVVQSASTTNSAWLILLVIIVLLTLGTGCSLILSAGYLEPLAETGRLNLRAAQMGSAGLKADQLARENAARSVAASSIANS